MIQIQGLRYIRPDLAYLWRWIMAIYPEITDRAVVITGAAAGIGEAAAIAFYKQGAHIFFLDIDQKKIGDIAANC